VILSDFTCPEHGRFEALADSDAEFACCTAPIAKCTCMHPDDRCGADCVTECGIVGAWSPSPVHGRVRTAEVERGGVDKPDSPMFLDTRELGEGMPMEEFRAKRDKMYEERRHAEGRDL
jgi:hypothetical protein